MTAFAGARTLAILALRRDRIVMSLAIAAFVLTAGVSSGATVGLYPSVASRVAAADSVNRSQALVALYGRVYDPTSTGAIAMFKLAGLGAVFVAMMAVVFVVRHTRADEETGRLELVASAPVGRCAPLASALAVTAAANLVLAIGTALALVATRLPLEGSFAFGFAWAGVGFAFAAIAGVVAQLTTSARAATAVSAAILGVVYVVRAVGDVAGEGGLRWLSWLSPIGWSQQFRPFAGNRWWVLLITVAFSIVIASVAVALASRRDFGAGLLPVRAGPARASKQLAGPLSLAWRLQRGLLLGWAIAFFSLGALVGSVAANVQDFVTNDSAREFFMKLGGEKGLTDAYLALELGLAGIIASAYGMQAVGRLASEEADLRAEPVLATATSRIEWAASHILIAVTGTLALLFLTGAGAALAHAPRAGGFAEASRLIAAALAQTPAALVMVAIVVALFGLGPRWVPAGWGVLAGFILLGEIGPLLDLSHWIIDLSPFAHAPKLPGGDADPVSLVALAAIAALTGIAGIAALRRRDIA